MHLFVNITFNPLCGYWLNNHTRMRIYDGMRGEDHGNVVTVLAVCSTLTLTHTHTCSIYIRQHSGHQSSFSVLPLLYTATKTARSCGQSRSSFDTIINVKAHERQVFSTDSFMFVQFIVHTQTSTSSRARDYTTHIYDHSYMCCR